VSITEAERNEIFESFKSQYGERIASNLMSMLPPVGWADVATKSDLHTVEVALRSDLNAFEVALRSDLNALDVALRSEIHRVESKFDQRFTRLESDLDQRFARFDQRMTQLESGFDQRLTRTDAAMFVGFADLRSEMHHSVRNQTWALVAWSTALAGLILAIGR